MSGNPRELPKFDADKTAERDKRATAFHEAGHVIAARHFGAYAWAKIWFAAPATVEERAWIGKAFYESTPMTPFRSAVVGFAGKLATEMMQTPRDEWHCALWWDWHHSGDEMDISETDLKAMHSTGQQWRAFKTAFNILARKWPAVEHEAALIEQFARVPQDEVEARALAESRW